jgi:hypothetical protein
MENALVLRCWVYFLILKGRHFGFSKQVLLLLEYKLLVMCERISSVLKIVYI